jgi:hypothetical protein
VVFRQSLVAGSAPAAWREREEVQETAYPKKKGAWRCLTGEGVERDMEVSHQRGGERDVSG